jgi:hypothetical protein
MEKVIKIQVEDKGKAVGTKGWVSARLSVADIKIAPSKSGNLSAFLKYTDPDTQKPVSRWIASIIQDIRRAEEQSAYGYVNINDNIQYAYCGRHEGAYDYAHAIFDVPLTDAAFDLVNELRSKALKALKEEWENDN